MPPSRTSRPISSRFHVHRPVRAGRRQPRPIGTAHVTPAALICTRCRRPNPADARFCTGCGAAIEPTCAACGTANPGDSRFCKACGQQLLAPAAAPADAGALGPDRYTPAHLVERILGSRATLEGERKQVTVLFADMRGSMRMRGPSSRPPEAP